MQMLKITGRRPIMVWRAITYGNLSKPFAHHGGVCFWIWQNKEPTGKPIAGCFDWTPLSGKHKLQVLKNLPAKMDTILKENIAPSVAKLWNVSDYCTVFGVTCNTIVVDALTSCLLRLPLRLSTDTT